MEYITHDTRGYLPTGENRGRREQLRNVITSTLLYTPNTAVKGLDDGLF